MVRALIEPALIICPCFADGFVRHQAAERLEATGKVVGCDEVSEVLSQLIMRFIVVRFTVASLIVRLIPSA